MHRPRTALPCLLAAACVALAVGCREGAPASDGGPDGSLDGDADAGVDGSGYADGFDPDADSTADGTIVAAEELELDEAERAALLDSAPAVVERMDSVRVQRITYLSSGLAVTGWIVEPRAGGPHPCVIYNRGGNLDFGAIDFDLVVYWISRFAALGYVVVASQYRGNDGGEGAEEFGGADVDDVLALIPLLSSYPSADGSRIGMYGHSRGGMMTYLALRRTDRIAAAIVDAGVADAFLWIEQRPEMEGVFEDLVPGYRDHREESLTERSVTRWPEELADVPFLLIHGEADERVDVSHARLAEEALAGAGRTVRLELFPGGDHALSGFANEEMELIDSWLGEHVRDR